MPSEHSSHSLCPVLDCARPRGHSLHDVWPVAFWNVPAPQLVQLEAAAVGAVAALAASQVGGEAAASAEQPISSAPCLDASGRLPLPLQWGGSSPVASDVAYVAAMVMVIVPMDMMS